MRRSSDGLSNEAVEERAGFEKIRYANCWEDADILLEALDLMPGSRVLSIASGGDNSLALLTASPELVVAVDLSPAQIAVTSLKAAAFRLLEYEEMLSFLGVQEDSCSQRIATYHALQLDLDAVARHFWDSRELSIANGLIHAGKFERYFQVFGRVVLPMVHSRSRIRLLMSQKSKEERVQFYNAEWNTWRWRLLFRVFFSRVVMGRAGRDPEFFRYVEGSVVDRILERGKHALTELDTYTNPYLNYIVLGNFGEVLPFYLRRENFDTIRNNLSSLRLVCGPVSDALQAHQGSFDAFNLSDIFEYMGTSLFTEIANELVHAASYGERPARFAYWNLLNPRSLADAIPGLVQPLPEIAGTLHAKDRAFFYTRFHVDERIPARRKAA